MSKVLVTEGHLYDIASAIRAKLDSAETYLPGDMAGAIRSIRPKTGALNATENGSYAPPEGLDGFDAVTVNVAGEYPAIDAVLSGALTGLSGLSTFGAMPPDDLSDAEVRFIESYARYKGGSQKDGSAIGTTVQLTEAIARESVEDFRKRFPTAEQWEYYDYVYGRADVIDALGLVLLGDLSQGGEASGNTLADSITNYSAILLQGIYKMTRNSGYNTCMLYHAPALNTAYWTGMKDRNTSYDCYVTFTDAQTVSLTGNRQVIIYGVP